MSVLPKYINGFDFNLKIIMPNSLNDSITAVFNHLEAFAIDKLGAVMRVGQLALSTKAIIENENYIVPFTAVHKSCHLFAVIHGHYNHAVSLITHLFLSRNV